MSTSTKTKRRPTIEDLDVKCEANAYDIDNLSDKHDALSGTVTDIEAKIGELAHRFDVNVDAASTRSVDQYNTDDKVNRLDKIVFKLGKRIEDLEESANSQPPNKRRKVESSSSESESSDSTSDSSDDSQDTDECTVKCKPKFVFPGKIDDPSSIPPCPFVIKRFFISDGTSSTLTAKPELSESLNKECEQLWKRVYQEDKIEKEVNASLKAQGLAGAKCFGVSVTRNTSDKVNHPHALNLKCSVDLPETVTIPDYITGSQ